MTCFLALVQGWTTLSPFNAGNFVDAYILLPLFPIIFIVYKLAFKTKLSRSAEVDLDYGRRRDLDDQKDETPSLADDGTPLVKDGFAKRLWRNF
jgi:amino acid transporter